MYWQITQMTRHKSESPAADAPRFVLHRHEDASGVHHDLRLEDGNCLVGFRITGGTVEPGCWATEKMPHPKTWLEEDKDAQRIHAGTYAWQGAEADRRELTLHTDEGNVTLRFDKCNTLDVEDIRALTTLVQEQRIAANTLASLVEDGLTARRNTVARFCGLSRELDGAGFDEQRWRDLLGGMTLRQVSEHLASVEKRFDRTHPPQPVSRPEPLHHKEHAQETRAQRAREILNQTD
jgi:hypothetical protein